MIPLLVAVFAGGVLTILGPCILPILPLVFARSEPALARQRVPLLAGLAVMFTLAASAATVSATWVARAGDIGRWIAIALLGASGLMLMSPAIAAVVSRPLVALGAGMDASAARRSPSVRGFLIGAAIGLLWAPCAGPILGLVVAAAVARGGGSSTALLFFTYAAGAATTLLVVLNGGGRLLARLRRVGQFDAALRPALGALTLAGVLVIASGWDRALYARAGVVGTTGLESRLVSLTTGAARSSGDRRVGIGESLDDVALANRVVLRDEGEMPELEGAVAWINASPLSKAALRGKVVMIDFWTFGCYNCLNALPHVKALEAKYRDRGFVVIGVHTPEFAHEKLLDNVRREVQRLGVVYPVPVDNDYRIWRAFGNEYWPAAYFVDKTGHIRYHHFGEGRYEEQDAVVRRLLDESPNESERAAARP